jgi:hypothetical protein
VNIGGSFLLAMIWSQMGEQAGCYGMATATSGDGADDFVSLCHQRDIDKAGPMMLSDSESESEALGNSQKVGIGSRGRARTYNLVVNSHPLYH